MVVSEGLAVLVVRWQSPSWQRSPEPFSTATPHKSRGSGPARRPGRRRHRDANTIVAKGIYSKGRSASHAGSQLFPTRGSKSEPSRSSAPCLTAVLSGEASRSLSGSERPAVDGLQYLLGGMLYGVAGHLEEGEEQLELVLHR